MNLKEGLVKIYEEIRSIEKEDFAWQKIRRLYNKSEEKYLSAKKEEITEEIEIERLLFFGEMFQAIYDFMEKLQSGEEMPPFQNGDLDFIQEITYKAPQMLEALREKNPPGEEDKDFFAKKREEIKELKKMVQEEKKKRGFSSTPSTNKPNPQDQQKIQNQQNEIDSLKQQLTELQNQIEELKQNQTTNDRNSNPKINQKIETLQEKKQAIQSELKQKQFQQKELKNKVNSQQNNSQPEKFNWLYVAIPGAVLLIIMGIVIVYLLGKKNKRE